MLGVDALGDASALARFFGGALLECLSSEKAEALGPHLSLCHSTVTARHTVDASAAWDLRLVLDYGRGSALQVALAGAAEAAAAEAAATAATVARAADLESGTDRTRIVAGSVPSGPRRGTEAEAEPPLPFTLLHPDLLASLEVRLDAFFSSLGLRRDGGNPSPFAEASSRSAAATEGVGKPRSRLWRYLYSDGGNGGDGGLETSPSREHRLFSAYLAYFGIPAPAALERALGGREVSSGGIRLEDAPALLRGLPGLTPSALLKISSSGGGT